MITIDFADMKIQEERKGTINGSQQFLSFASVFPVSIEVCLFEEFLHENVKNEIYL